MKNRAFLTAAVTMQIACGQIAPLEVDVYVNDANDGFRGLLELGTDGIRTGTVARVKGRRDPGDGGGGEWVWSGASWTAMESRAMKALSDFQEAQQANVSPLSETQPQLTESSDLNPIFNLYGWYKARDGASTTGPSTETQATNSQAVNYWFDRSSSDLVLDTFEGSPSFWTATNNLSTGAPALSFAPLDRTLYRSGFAPDATSGLVAFGIAQSDLSSSSDPLSIDRRIFSLHDAGPLLSVGLEGEFLKVEFENSGGSAREIMTSYDVVADEAFYYVISFDAGSNEWSVRVNGQEVGSLAGEDLNSLTGAILTVGGIDGHTSDALADWDGKIAEVGFIQGDLSGSEIVQLESYLADVSLLGSGGSGDGGILATATLAQIQAVDPTATTYATNLNHTGRIAVGVVTSSNGTLSIDVNGTVTVLPMTSAGLFNNPGSTYEYGAFVDLPNASNTVTLSLSSGALSGVVFRAPDSISGTVEDQGTATHCSPRVIAHSSGKTFRYHAEMYTGDRWVSDGLGSVKVFDGITEDLSERYHNGGALIELPNSDILAIMVGHNRPFIYTRLIIGGDLGNLGPVRTFLDASTRLTYVHAETDGTGRVFLLIRDESGTNEVILVTIDDAEQLSSSSFTSESLCDTDRRIYPRALNFFAAENKLTMVFASREGSRWDALGAAVKDLANDQFETIDGQPAAIDEPYFRGQQVSGSLLAGDTGSFFVERAQAGEGTYYPNSLLRGESSSSFSCLISTSPLGALDYGASKLRWVSVHSGQVFTGDVPSDSAGNSYRLEGHFIKRSENAGLLLTTHRGASRANVDELGNVTPFYYDWSGSGISSMAYRIKQGRLFFSLPKIIMTDDQSQAGHGWFDLVRTDSGSVVLEVQRGLNQVHYTRRQTTRSEIRIENFESE